MSQLSLRVFSWFFSIKHFSLAVMLNRWHCGGCEMFSVACVLFPTNEVGIKKNQFFTLEKCGIK